MDIMYVLFFVLLGLTIKSLLAFIVSLTITIARILGRDETVRWDYSYFNWRFAAEIAILYYFYLYNFG